MSSLTVPPPHPPPEGTPRTYRHGIAGLSDRSRDQQKRFAHDIEWKIVGPMPVEDFLNEFFPCSGSMDLDQEFEEEGIAYKDINFDSVPDSPDRENEMYAGLCAGLEVIARGRGLTFCDAHKYAEKSGELGTVKPDICLYNRMDENRGLLFNIKYNKDKEVSNRGYFAHMGLVYLFIEVKKNANQDIFIDPSDDSLPDHKFTVDTWANDESSNYRISALGQNAHYAHMIQTRQFRTCVFSLTISGSTARIMRWDRSGVLVTSAFDYKANPLTLIEFVWRFAKANKEQQGFDRTANSTKSDEDRRSFVKAITSHVRLQLALGPDTAGEVLGDAVNTHYCGGVVSRVGMESYDVWVSRPLWVSHAIVGRCTAGYWGVRCDTKEVVFLKDVWRTDVETVQSEGAILSYLTERGVSHIPALVGHGDVTFEDMSQQVTHTNRFVEKPWVKSLHPDDPRLRIIIPRAHYRLVTTTAGYPLSTFRGSRELFEATYHGFTAVVEAHEKAQTLHRDVSLPNIILHRSRDGGERAGYLVDWELGRSLNSMKSRDNVLTGTPAFMSFKALNSQRHMHSLKDDLESFIYVILFASLRWLPVQPKPKLDWWLTTYFGAPNPDGSYGGADSKCSNALTRKYTRGLRTKESPHILEWLNNAMDLHYKDGVPNPAWDDGKALGNMWRDFLATDLPHADRCVNVASVLKFRGEGPLGVTYILDTTAMKKEHNDSSQPSPSVPAKRPQSSGGRAPKKPRQEGEQS